MHFRTILFLLLSLAPPALPAAAAEAPLVLKRAEAMAMEHNPALAGAGSRAEALAAVPAQVGALPDPQLSLAALNLPTDSFATGQEAMTQMQLGISQAIPFPGKLGLRQSAAEKMAEAASHNRDEAQLMLLRNVRIGWWNLAWLDKALAIIDHNVDLLRDLVRIAEARYKTGQGLQQDVLLAQLELSKMQERQLDLQATRQRQAARFNALLGRPSQTPVALPAIDDRLRSELPNTDELKRKARQRRPMLLALQRKADAAGDRVALAERDYYPDFKLGAAYGYRHGLNANGSRRPDLASVQLSLNLPIFTADKQERQLDQRRAEEAGAEFDWQDAADRVDAEIEAAVADLYAARQRAALFRQGILPQARQTTASMMAGYQVDRVDFLNLMRARLNEFNTDIQYWRQIASAHQAAARLAAAAGLETLNEEPRP